MVSTKICGLLPCWQQRQILSVGGSMKLVLSTTIAIMAAVILLLIMALYDAHQKMRKLREDLEVREIVFRKIEKQAMEQKSITENLTTTILKMIEEKRGSKINKGKDAKSKEIPN